MEPSLPLIDFAPFLSGNEQVKKACAREILRAFQTFGFLYLQNCPIYASGQVKRAFETSASFFSMPMEEKMKIAWKLPESNRGYVEPGREKGKYFSSLDVSLSMFDSIAAGQNGSRSIARKGTRPERVYRNRQGALSHVSKRMARNHAGHAERNDGVLRGLPSVAARSHVGDSGRAGPGTPLF